MNINIIMKTPREGNYEEYCEEYLHEALRLYGCDLRATADSIEKELLEAADKIFQNELTIWLDVLKRQIEKTKCES